MAQQIRIVKCEFTTLEFTPTGDYGLKVAMRADLVREEISKLEFVAGKYGRNAFLMSNIVARIQGRAVVIERRDKKPLAIKEDQAANRIEIRGGPINRALKRTFRFECVGHADLRGELTLRYNGIKVMGREKRDVCCGKKEHGYVAGTDTLWECYGNEAFFLSITTLMYSGRNGGSFALFSRNNFIGRMTRVGEDAAQIEPVINAGNNRPIKIAKIEAVDAIDAIETVDTIGAIAETGAKD